MIVIVGPTASGKTGLAIKIAKKFDGEIISADSRAIYKHMDIGTAKPTPAELDGVRCWGIDLVEPDELFTVADFQEYANEAIKDIYSRGKLPILCGGSGLYIDSVIFNYEFPKDSNEKIRKKLNSMSVEELTAYCKENNITLPENSKNKRYLIRTIERGGKVNSNRDSIRDDCTVFGIKIGKEELLDRIIKRADIMFSDEIEKETKYLADRYSFEIESMKSNIYPIVNQMMNGEISLAQAKELFITDDWHLAKKQNTWFKRNQFIKWHTTDEIEQIIGKMLTKNHNLEIKQ